MPRDRGDLQLCPAPGGRDHPDGLLPGGPWCPPESTHGINVVNVPRDTLFRKGGNTTYLDPATGEPVTVEGIAITADDQDSMLDTWLRKGRCPYHTEETWQQQQQPQEPEYARPDHYDEWGNPLNADGTPWQPPAQGNEGSSDSGMEPPIDPENPGGTEPPDHAENPDEPGVPQEPGGDEGLSGFLDGLFGSGGQPG